MTPVCRKLTVFFILGLILLPLSVPAGSGKPEARKLFKQGQTDYTLGKFEEALEKYSKAYELNPLPDTLFGMALCHYKLEDYEKAIFFFKGYLRDKPGAKNRAQVEQRIAESEKKFKEQQADLRRQEELERKRQEEQKRKDDIAALEMEEKLADVNTRKERELKKKLEEEKQARVIAEGTVDLFTSLPPEPVEPVAQEPKFYQKWWFWTLVGVVVAGAAGGTIYAVTAGDNEVMPSGTVDTLDFRGL